MVKKKPIPPESHCVSCNRGPLAKEDRRYGPPLRGWAIRCIQCWEKEAGKGVQMEYVPEKSLSHIELQEKLHKQVHHVVEAFDKERAEWGIDAREAAWNEHLRMQRTPAGPWDKPGTGYDYQRYLKFRFPGKYHATKDEKA